MTEPVSYEFGPFLVDLRTLTVTREGVSVPLEPKTFDVLVLLIRHRERLVTKEELLDAGSGRFRFSDRTVSA